LEVGMDTLLNPLVVVFGFLSNLFVHILPGPLVMPALVMSWLAGFGGLLAGAVFLFKRKHAIAGSLLSVVAIWELGGPVLALLNTLSRKP